MGDHPFQTGFYLLAIIASVYGNNIRTFLSIPPQKLNIWLIKSRLKSTAIQLENLTRVYKNGFNLLLYILPDILSMLMISIAFLSIMALNITIIARTLSTHVEFTRMESRVNMVLSMLSIIYSLRLFKLIIFLSRLNNFKESSHVLSARIARLSQKLEKVGVVIPTEEA